MSRLSYAHDVHVVCLNNAVGECNTGQIRLAGGNTNLEGRLEVCFAGQWVTVTDDGWSTPDAKVVCRQLGFNDGCKCPVDRSTGFIVCLCRCTVIQQSLFWTRICTSTS